ncbi:hypothetical protein NC651_013614 [Populus alba x Populus x berolinensis]|nr:hypothetical protein NC651_013614 [Populus alba x Populus x berolinensis]
MTGKQGLKVQKSTRAFWLSRSAFVLWTMTRSIYHLEGASS